MDSQLGEPISSGLVRTEDRMMLISEAASSPCTIALPASGGPSKFRRASEGPWHSRQLRFVQRAAGCAASMLDGLPCVVGAAQALQVNRDRAQVFVPEVTGAVGDHGIHQTEAAGPHASALAEIVDDVLGLPAREALLCRAQVDRIPVADAAAA